MGTPSKRISVVLRKLKLLDYVDPQIIYVFGVVDARSAQLSPAIMLERARQRR